MLARRASLAASRRLPRSPDGVRVRARRRDEVGNRCAHWRSVPRTDRLDDEESGETESLPFHADGWIARRSRMAAHVPAFCTCGRCPDDIAEKVCCNTAERWASAADRGTCVTTTARFRQYAADRAHLTKTGTTAPPSVPTTGRALWISRARHCGHSVARARALLREQARPCAPATSPEPGRAASPCHARRRPRS